MATKKSPSWINEAIKLTTRTIEVRASRFRVYVISVVVIVLISIVCTAIQMSWRPLLGFLLLVPLCGAFLYLDNRLVCQWQQQILEKWSQDHLELELFSKAITTLPMLPPRTLHGMLALLPTTGNTYAPDTMTSGTRKALILTLQSINRYHNDHMTFTSLAGILGLISLGLATFLWTLLPLLGLLFVPLVLGLYRWVTAYRFRRWRQNILAMQHSQELGLQNLVAVVSQVDWGPMPDKQKQKLLKFLTAIT